MSLLTILNKYEHWKDDTLQWLKDYESMLNFFSGLQYAIIRTHTPGSNLPLNGFFGSKSTTFFSLLLISNDPTFYANQQLSESSPWVGIWAKIWLMEWPTGSVLRFVFNSRLYLHLVIPAKKLQWGGWSPSTLTQRWWSQLSTKKRTSSVIRPKCFSRSRISTVTNAYKHTWKGYSELIWVFILNLLANGYCPLRRSM